jgi:hypothetical protein
MLTYSSAMTGISRFEDRHDGGSADELLEAFIVGMHCHGSIAEDGLGADGCDGDKFVRTFDHVLEVIQLHFLFAVFHLEVRDGGLEARRPVDQARTTVDQSLFVEVDKGLPYCPAQPIVEGEAFPAPVAGRAEAADLVRDDAAVLVLPFPGALDEFLAPEFLAGHFLVLQQVASTMSCVAMPAWSLPGTHSVGCPSCGGSGSSGLRC